MSWTDKKSIDTFKKLRDKFNVTTYIETGTFMGDGAAVASYNFKQVITCEVNQNYYTKSLAKLKQYSNVVSLLGSSADILSDLKKTFIEESEIVFVYLDAHFYDKTLPPDDRWVVLKELRAMRGWRNCVIAIHDFDCNGLGHLVYDGQSLNFDLVQDDLYNVNPYFHYYFNTQSGCDIMTKERVANGEIPGLTLNDTVDDNLNYVWSNPVKTYRGILYAVPEQLPQGPEFDLVGYYA